MHINNATAEVKKRHINVEGRDEQSSFSNCFSSMRSQIFIHKNLKTYNNSFNYNCPDVRNFSTHQCVLNVISYNYVVSKQPS